MKNIGILEFHCHVKYLYTLAKICKTKDTNVTIFTTKDLFSKVTTYIKNINDYEIILKDNDESLSDFFQRVEKICNEKIDLLFINTIQKTMLDFPLFFSFKPKCKMILTIHTANAWFYKKPSVDFKKIFRTVDTNISTFFGRKMILPKFNAVNVIYSPIKDFIVEKTPYSKPVFTFPFGFYDKVAEKKTKKDDEIIFVVPGQVEEHRRDYDVVMDAFKNVFKKHGNKIKLYLLGYPVGVYGKRIHNRSEELKKQGYNIMFYDDFVPEDEYNDTMKNVDFLILPIKILSRGVGVTPEYYGTTKGSAAVFEAIQYARPMVVPDEFNMLSEMESSTLKYKNASDMADQINKLVENHDKIKSLQNEAYQNSEKFSLEKLQDYFVEEIIEKFDQI